jgi:hypothetical protein
MATEDEVEMEKYLREAQRAAKKAQATKNILARGLGPSDAHMEEKRFLNNMEKEIFWPGSDDEGDADVDEELDDVDRTLLSLGPGDETDDELSEPNVFFRKAKGSNSEQNNHVSTELVNLTAPEETNDSCSEQSETSNPFDNRDDAPSGRNLLVLVDPNRVARIFGPVSRKPWKPSERLSSINSTISKDNTAGECARQAKLFADFGQKMKMKQCRFGSAHREEGILHEAFNPFLEAPILFEKDLPSQRRREILDNDLSTKFGLWDTSPSRLVPPFQRQQLSLPRGSPPGVTFRTRNKGGIFPS